MAPLACSTDSDQGRLAVYGTLWSDPSLIRRFAGYDSAVRYAGGCLIRGCLVSLGRFPALIAGDGVVRGGLYEGVQPPLLEALDRYEGVDDVTQAPTGLVRRLTRLVKPARDAWVYLLEGSPPHAEPIPSGDWREFVGAGPAAPETTVQGSD